MERPCNIVIPMAGLGSRFTDYGFKINKYLLPIDDRLTKMIESAIVSLNAPAGTGFIFILREESGPDTSLRILLTSICHKNNYNCKICSSPSLTEGPTSTVYIAKEYINNDTPLIVSNSDQILDWNFNSFYDHCSSYDGGVLTYKPSYELIPGSKDKNSFVRCDHEGKPLQFTEKIVISDEALVGVHYYKKGSYFVEAAEYTFENNMRAPNGEFYLSLTYQAMIHLGKSLTTYNLSNNGGTYYAVGEPGDYFKYYNKNAPIITQSLTEFVDSFKINECNFRFSKSLGETITFRDELVIVLNEAVSHDCSKDPFARIVNLGSIFLSGPVLQRTFPENTIMLRHPIYTECITQPLNLANYLRGWIIGNFQPSVYKTPYYEIGLLTHAKDEKWEFHYHKQVTEINILISGHFLLNNIPISAGTVFTINKNVIACPKFLETCKILCIKIPSIPGDKTII
jgi:dTDP-glucose pyrophosphorylase